MDRIGPVFRYSFLLLRGLPPTPSCTRATLLTKKLVLVFTMAAPVIIVNDYTTFNAKVNQTIGADGDTEVASMLGKKLATSGAWEADKFPNSGTIAPAEVGAAMAHLDQLGDKVDWSAAVFTWNGRDDDAFEVRDASACVRNQTFAHSYASPIYAS